MLNYKNFNQLNENAIDGMVSNIVEEKLLEFLTNRNEDVFLELKEDVNGILMTDEDGNFEYIDEEEYVTLMEHFDVIDEDEGWCVGTVDPIALSGIYENEEISDLKECALHIFLDERILESFIDDVYARVDEFAFAPIAGAAARALPTIARVAPKVISGVSMAKDMYDTVKKEKNRFVTKQGKQQNEGVLGNIAQQATNLYKTGQKFYRKNLKSTVAAGMTAYSAASTAKAAYDLVKPNKKQKNVSESGAMLQNARHYLRTGKAFLLKHRNNIEAASAAVSLATAAKGALELAKSDNQNKNKKEQDDE